MNELLMMWGTDPVEVDAQTLARIAGRNYRVLRRDRFALVSAESTNPVAALDSNDVAYCVVVEIQA